MDKPLGLEHLQDQLDKLHTSQRLERAKLFYKKALLYKKDNQDQAIHYFAKALDVALEFEDIVFPLNILNELAWAHKVKGEHSKSLSYLNKSLELVGEEGDLKILLTLLSRIGSIRVWMAQYDVALDCYLKSLKMSQKLQSRKHMCSAYNNIAYTYQRMGFFEKSIDFFYKAIKEFRFVDNNRMQSEVYTGLGNSLFAIDDKNASLEYHLKSLECAEKTGENYAVADSLVQTASVQRELGYNELSLANLNRAYKIHNRIGEMRGSAETLYNIGLSLALNGQHKESVEHIYKGIAIAKKIEAPDVLMNCYKALSTVFEVNQNFERALIAHKEYSAIHQEIFTEKALTKFNQLQSAYEKDSKEKENEIYKLKYVELSEKNLQLNQAMSEIKRLSGLLPICAVCHKVRSDSGYWEQIETYISEHSDATFSHGICPDCVKSFYPETEIS